MAMNFLSVSRVPHHDQFFAVLRIAPATEDHPTVGPLGKRFPAAGSKPLGDEIADTQPANANDRQSTAPQGRKERDADDGGQIGSHPCRIPAESLRASR